jgi:hypothetical protein
MAASPSGSRDDDIMSCRDCERRRMDDGSGLVSPSLSLAVQPGLTGGWCFWPHRVQQVRSGEISCSGLDDHHRPWFNTVNTASLSAARWSNTSTPSINVESSLVWFVSMRDHQRDLHHAPPTCLRTLRLMSLYGVLRPTFCSLWGWFWTKNSQLFGQVSGLVDA